MIGALTAAGIAGGCAAGVIAYGVAAPRCSLFGRVIGRGSRGAPPRVALTFDDGPDPIATPAILDLLRDRRVPAAFFVIGRNALDHPHILHRASAEGHLIGNHTHDHHRWGGWRFRRYWMRQLREASAAITAATGHRPRFFRPPVGIKTPIILRVARREGLDTVTWSRRGLDGVTTTADAITRRIVPRASAGDIIVLHDGVEPGRRRDPGPTLDALPGIIDGLRDRGLTFERLDRLIGTDGGQGR